MTREETLQALSVIKAAYPLHYKNLTRSDAQVMVSLWSMQFAEVPAEVFGEALKRHIKGSTFPPTVAEIGRQLVQMRGEAEKQLLTDSALRCLSEGERAECRRIWTGTEKYSKTGKV